MNLFIIILRGGGGGGGGRLGRYNYSGSRHFGLDPLDPFALSYAFHY